MRGEEYDYFRYKLEVEQAKLYIETSSLNSSNVDGLISRINSVSLICDMAVIWDCAACIMPPLLLGTVAIGTLLVTVDALSTLALFPPPTCTLRGDEEAGKEFADEVDTKPTESPEVGMLALDEVRTVPFIRGDVETTEATVDGSEAVDAEFKLSVFPLE